MVEKQFVMNGGDIRFLCEIENKSQEVQRIIKSKQIWL